MSEPPPTLLSAFSRVNPLLWQAERTVRPGMRVPARVYATRELLQEAARDRSLEQLINLTTLPGVVRFALAMPDIHQGYGSPVGGVVATDIEAGGIISPGMIGYDINCGVRLLRTSLDVKALQGHQQELGHELSRAVPSGVGRGGRIKLDPQGLDQVLRRGAAQLVELGLGTEQDLEFIESNGCLTGADPRQVSQTAKARGYDQLGTMGAGNHFVEVQRVATIFDPVAARALGLTQDQVVVMIHTGSRGLGHQIATDWIRSMVQSMPKYNVRLPDRELAGVPYHEPEGQSYFAAMACGANFAWANRQAITAAVRRGFASILGKHLTLEVVYDVAHNIGKLERHPVGRTARSLLVHRKGATRSFGPGHPEIPERYRPVGQPVLIPGSMGTSSFVLVGTEQAMTDSFGSSCHGAGRRLSRHAALKRFSGKQLKQELEQQGIHIMTASLKGLAEEAPLAYKEVDNVVSVVEQAGLAKRVALLKPLIVVKG
ncbi:MAG: RtcB family protein [Parcubacteria group bacterium]